MCPSIHVHGHNDMTTYGILDNMKRIPAGEFKARCLALMEDVRSTRQPIVITKRGKPIARLVPEDEPKDDFIGRLKGIIKIVGDIESPVVPPEDWKALK